MAPSGRRQTGARPRPLRHAFSASVLRFLSTENAGAKLLALAALAALVWANSPWSDAYESLWSWPLPAEVPLTEELPDLRHWVNDGLMTLFFLVVGLEIKREVVAGELGTWRKAALPGFAALGGMVAPALFYAALNSGSPAAPGWGIPMATDIAFAVALLALVSPRAPRALTVFLLSLAIVDDIGAVAVIALFYAEQTEVGWLVAGGVLLLTFRVVARGRPDLGLASYTVVCLALWLVAVRSGVHPTIAGALMGLVLPVRPTARDSDRTSLSERLETSLHPWTSLAIVPLFALANAGVHVDPGGLGAALGSRAGLGIVLGLVVGKTVGITMFSWVAVNLHVAELPSGIDWIQVTAAGAVAGIGFTVALFINELAFGTSQLGLDAKLAVMVGSAVAASLGTVLLKIAAPVSDTGSGASL